jgi:hypothetical protein
VPHQPKFYEGVRVRKNGLVLTFYLYLVGCLTSVSTPAGAAESPPLRKIRAAITSISGSMVPLPGLPTSRAYLESTACRSK